MSGSNSAGCNQSSVPGVVGGTASPTTSNNTYCQYSGTYVQNAQAAANAQIAQDAYTQGQRNAPGNQR